MDRAVGTLGSTGGSGKLGGALANSDTIAGSVLANQNTVWIKTGTYNITTSFHISNTYQIIGYGSSHGDNGTAPTLNMTASSTQIVNGWSNGQHVLHNLNLTTSAATKTSAIGGSASVIVISRCTITGFTSAMGGGGGTLVVRDSLILNSTSVGLTATNFLISNSVISGSGGAQLQTSGGQSLIVRSLIVDGAAEGFKATGVGCVITLIQSTIANNAGSAVRLQSATSVSVFLESNIIFGNGGYGVENDSTQPLGLIAYANYGNALGSNTSGSYLRVPAGSADVALTANPFTNSGSGDYSLNNTAGGGAACKGVGYPGAFPNGTTTGTLDMGAVQTGSCGGGGSASANYSFVG
jgi:hypothetical protein